MPKRAHSPPPNMSPPPDSSDMAEPEPKRRRSAPPPLDLSVATALKPETILDVIEDGDVLLVVSKLKGEEKRTGLRCSSAALSMASPIFKTALAAPVTPAVPAPPATDSSATSSVSATAKGKIISLPEDDGDTLLLVLQILHFRNQALPSSISPDSLMSLAVLATKYRCSQAISRATTQWFDRIYIDMESSPTTQPAEVLQMIQAALLLDEAMYFARFTSHYVRTAPCVRAEGEPALPEGVKRIKNALLHRQSEDFAAIRLDLDILLEPCAISLGKESHHYVDCPPDTEPEEGDLPEPGSPAECIVDTEAATLYLGTLRNAGLWPPTAWGTKTVEQLIEAVATFREPEFDDSEKCEFCLPLVEHFASKLMLVKKVHKQRLWGLCLDCFKNGGAYTGECRYSHVRGVVKVKLEVWPKRALLECYDYDCLRNGYGA